MTIYLVIRKTQWKIPCCYGDYGDYWETETDVISAHRNFEDAERMIKTETALETNDDVSYDWECIELE